MTIVAREEKKREFWAVRRRGEGGRWIPPKPGSVPPSECKPSRAPEVAFADDVVDEVKRLEAAIEVLSEGSPGSVAHLLCLQFVASGKVHDAERARMSRSRGTVVVATGTG